MLPAKYVNTLGDADETVLVAAGKIEQFQFPARGGRIGHEVGGRPGVGSGGKTAHPRQGIEVRDAEIERLSPTHRKAGQGAMLAVGAGRIFHLNGGNETIQQVPLELRETGGILRRVDLKSGKRDSSPESR